ncbi:cobalamin-dependent protein [Candidatus Woesearchaeota archaeon]|nr:cobalamin-dependent protein [Candidatus Woesearchaeota archaeon]
MDILFVYPPISVNERYASNVGNVGGNLSPLGIALLAAFLREKGFSVGIIDAVAEDYSVGELVERISEIKPKTVGFSSLTSNFHRAVAAAREVKKALPDTLTVIGGQHATILPEEVLKENPCFDVLVKGEGELTAEELLNEYKKTGWNINKFLSNCEGIKGLCFRKGKEIILNNIREPVSDVDELPFPARDLLPMDKYIPLPNQYKRKPVVNMIVTRGCAFSCSFCSASAVFGRIIRMRSPEKSVSEIKHVVEKYGAKEISFWDDTMTVNKKWMHRFCELIIENKLDITWSCYSRVNTVDYELLKHMKDAGCWNVFFGYESGTQELLNNIAKGITIEQIENANKLCKQVGIEIRASFMLALPGETPELAQKTIDFAKRLNPDYAQFSPTTPYPGTKLWNDAEKYGKLTKNFSEYHGWSAVFVPFGYKDRKEVEEMKRRAVRQFYIRPNYILGRIMKINSLEDIKRYVKGVIFLLGFMKKARS